jgi:surface antigen
MKRKPILIALISISIGLAFTWCFKNVNFNFSHKVGDKIDSLSHVIVYFNGGVNQVENRNTTDDGYNIGLRYQCVEFVKRYYLEVYDHRMTDSYGHAKDFFDEKVRDGEINKQRNLLQLTNPGKSKPQIGDILVFSPTIFNRFGHVAIVSAVNYDDLEWIQQNPGPFSSSRENAHLFEQNGNWHIESGRIMGWLRVSK